jgi:hypothetical protein
MPERFAGRVEAGVNVGPLEVRLTAALDAVAPKATFADLSRAFEDVDLPEAPPLFSNDPELMPDVARVSFLSSGTMRRGEVELRYGTGIGR